MGWFSDIITERLEEQYVAQQAALGQHPDAARAQFRAVRQTAALRSLAAAHHNPSEDTPVTPQSPLVGL